MRLIAIIICSVLYFSGAYAQKRGFSKAFVEVSPQNPNCFQLSNGSPYIPNGCNIAGAKDMATMESYLKSLSENGGNFARVWLNHRLFEIETEYGKVNEVNFANVEKLLQLALKYNLKLKLCLQSFRGISADSTVSLNNAVYHVSKGGPFNNMKEYINTQKGRDEYLKRVSIFQKKFGNHPAVFGWELWNEMNAVKVPDIEDWNVYMLPKVKAMFPKNMVMQSLGSLDRKSFFPIYNFINALKTNEVAQTHRYIDMGAELDISGIMPK
jgi:endo-1,4-beta-mannosidase